MTKDEVLKLALYALIDIYDAIYVRSEQEAKAIDKCAVAIQAIKEVLQRHWIPLTDEEKDSLLLPFGSYWVIDAIEAKLKEKNGVSIN
jgi:hypothetical protein